MNSFTASFFSPVDSLKISEIGLRLDEPPQAISYGLKSSTAALIGGLASRAGDSIWMNQVFNLISAAPSNVDASDLANSALGLSRASPTVSSLVDSGGYFRSLIFGRNQSSVCNLVGQFTGLRSSVITSLMRIAAPLLLTTLSRLVREGVISPSGLKDLFTYEGEDVRSLLPAGFSDLLKGEPLQPQTTGP
jgi:hypothetical protein